MTRTLLECTYCIMHDSHLGIQRPKQNNHLSTIEKIGPTEAVMLLEHWLHTQQLMVQANLQWTDEQKCMDGPSHFASGDTYCMDRSCRHWVVLGWAAIGSTLRVSVQERDRSLIRTQEPRWAQGKFWRCQRQFSGGSRSDNGEMGVRGSRALSYQWQEMVSQGVQGHNPKQMCRKAEEMILWK